MHGQPITCHCSNGLSISCSQYDVSEATRPKYYTRILLITQLLHNRIPLKPCVHKNILQHVWGPIIIYLFTCCFYLLYNNTTDSYSCSENYSTNFLDPPLWPIQVTNVFVQGCSRWYGWSGFGLTTIFKISFCDKQVMNRSAKVIIKLVKQGKFRDL